MFNGIFVFVNGDFAFRVRTFAYDYSHHHQKVKKRLYLVRHAKAESGAPMFKDFERELTGEGYIDAARMAAFLNGRGEKVQRIVASSAFRTRQTAQVFAEQLGFDWEQVELIDDLYDCGARAYIAAVNSTPAEATNLMLVGHNPDISYFAEYLTRDFYESMGKSSVCVIEFEGLEWAEISGRTGTLTGFFSVRNLPIN